MCLCICAISEILLRSILVSSQQQLCDLQLLSTYKSDDDDDAGDDDDDDEDDDQYWFPLNSLATSGHLP